MSDEVRTHAEVMEWLPRDIARLSVSFALTCANVVQCHRGSFDPEISPRS